MHFVELNLVIPGWHTKLYGDTTLYTAVVSSVCYLSDTHLKHCLTSFQHRHMQSCRQSSYYFVFYRVKIIMSFKWFIYCRTFLNALSVHAVQMFNSMETCEITTNIGEQWIRISHHMSSNIPCPYLYSGGKIYSIEKHSLILDWYDGRCAVCCDQCFICWQTLPPVFPVGRHSERRLVLAGRESGALSVCLVPSLLVSQD